MKAKQSKAHYTLEFKQEAIRLVKPGQPLKQVATTLGMPYQTLDNWMRADNLGKLSGSGERVVTPEKMELLAIAFLTMHCSRISAPYIVRSKVNMGGLACGKHCKLNASKSVKNACAS